MSYLTNQILRGAETIKRMTTTDTPRTDAARFEALRGLALRQDCIPLKLGQELELELLAARDDNFNLANALSKAEAEVEELKKGKVFVDPKWIYDLEAQLAKAHEELCQAGLREYGN